MSFSAPIPTDTRETVASELQRWTRAFAGPQYFYGCDPGPVARRAVRYHRPILPAGGVALDIGCGEGQDLRFLAESGYGATGIELTEPGASKARALIEERGLSARVIHGEFLATPTQDEYDLVLAVNSLQFLGIHCPEALDRAMGLTRPGGVLGLSLFGRTSTEPQLRGTVWFFTLEEVLERFQGWQPMEAARLWQWNSSSGTPQEFVTLIARKAPPSPQWLQSRR